MIPTVLGGARPRFAGLEEHLPDILVGGIIKLPKSLVLGWIKLPQGTSSALTRESQANKHHLDYVDEFDIPVNHALNARLEQ